VGADLFGQAVCQRVQAHGAHLAANMVVDPAATTSYTVIISPPGVDRIFLHHSGANDTFCAADVSLPAVEQAALFHFGYPPLMRRMYAEAGAELARLFARVKATGVTTSLDMAFPDPAGPAARADWPAILRATLPHVDVFMPSVEEILFMLRRPQFDELQAAGPLAEQVTPELLSSLGAELLALGAKIVGLKLGDRGLYVRTAPGDRLAEAGRGVPRPAAWAGQELWAPCFQVDVVGTTGSGDATIAGFLSALLRGLAPAPALTCAVAVGAHNVEAPDALSGLRSWDATLARVARGWPRRPLQVQAPGWRWQPEAGVWSGPAQRREAP
jgi:sugar/nucleoside kinase (ribokinase family)